MSQPTQPAAPPPPARKRRKWPWILAGLAVLLVIIVAISSGGGSSSGQYSSTPSMTAPQPTPSPVAANPLSDKGWTVSDIQVTRSSSIPDVSARLTNSTGASATGSFTLTIWGADGTRLAAVDGYADNVGAGQTVTTTFIGSQDKLTGDPATYHYQLQTNVSY